MFTVTKNQTIALAGLYQSLSLVQHLAWEGNAQHSCMTPTIGSVLRLDADSYMDVYGSVNDLHLGIQTLKAALQNKSEKHAIERTRYAISLMYLAAKLEKNSHTSSLLSNQFERISHGYESVSDSIDEITQELGILYREYVSPLGPRLMIEGDPSHLKSEENAGRIRALLLAAIRAIVLWKQAGGKRWSLLLGRKSLLAQLLDLERNLQHPPHEG